MCRNWHCNSVNSFWPSTVNVVGDVVGLSSVSTPSHSPQDGLRDPMQPAAVHAWPNLHQLYQRNCSCSSMSTPYNTVINNEWKDIAAWGLFPLSFFFLFWEGHNCTLIVLEILDIKGPLYFSTDSLKHSIKPLKNKMLFLQNNRLFRELTLFGCFGLWLELKFCAVFAPKP